jgi:hypothetical protein
VIILRLELVGLGSRHITGVGERVVFCGCGSEYAQGFVLSIPPDEWRALGEPREVEFVLSGEALSVGEGQNVRERPL